MSEEQNAVDPSTGQNGSESLLAHRPGFGIPSAFSQKIERAWAAWIELSQYGAHEGECEFPGECEHCKSKLGGCSRHREAFERRNAQMEEAMRDLKKLLKGSLDGSPAGQTGLIADQKPGT